MLKSARITVFLCSFAALLAAPATRADSADEPLYAQLLAQYTSESDDVAGTRVDYAGLGAEANWERIVSKLRSSQPQQLPDRSAKLAFWINAYNILAIQTVLDGYPLDSIRDLGSFFSPVWKRDAGQIGGRTVTLHEIEHGILRPMKDPRIHAAIVCASTSCPSLRRTPFTSENIDHELDEAMRTFLSDDRKGLRIDRASKTLTLSSIFDWFEEDFEAQGGIPGALITFVAERDQAWLRENAAALAIEYFDYDWRLNDTTPEARRR